MMAIATKFKKVNIIISAFQICPREDYDNLWLSSEEILKKEDKLYFVNVIRRQKSRKLINPSQRMCQESSLIEDNIRIDFI
jgi:hypothetical protein